MVTGILKIIALKKEIKAVTEVLKFYLINTGMFLCFLFYAEQQRPD